VYTERQESTRERERTDELAERKKIERTSVAPMPTAKPIREQVCMTMAATTHREAQKRSKLKKRGERERERENKRIQEILKQRRGGGRGSCVYASTYVSSVESGR
jgi:hypothetical protein